MSQQRITLSLKQKSSLKIVATHGAENGAHALGKWLRHPAKVEVGDLGMMHMNRVPELVGGPEAPVVCVATGIRKDIDGVLYCVFPEKTAFELCDSMLRLPLGQTKMLGEMEESALRETVNIVGCAFLNAFGQALGYSIHPTIPSLAHDLAGPLLEMMFMEYAALGDEVLVMEMEFSLGDGTLDWHFFLQPSPVSLRKLLERFDS